MNKFRIALALLIASYSTNAQELIPIGDWRSHFNYQNAKFIAKAENRIYCSTENGLFFFDQQDRSLNRLTRTDGLSDVSVSAMTFSSSSGWLIIGYESGNVDLYKDDEIINLTQIMSAQLTGSKRINHISTFNDFAYLSTDFGVVVLDLFKIEIKETYLNLGPAGERSNVRQSLVLSDSLYLATDLGLISGSLLGDDNLLDFQSWTRTSNIFPTSNPSIDYVNSTGNLLIAGSSENGIYKFENGRWEQLPLDRSDDIISVSIEEDAIFISYQNELISFTISSENVSEIDYSENPRPSDVFVDGETLWIADNQSGLFGGQEGAFQQFVISGPASNNIGQLYFFDNQVLALHSTINDFADTNNLEHLSIFKNGDWEVKSTEMSSFGNMVDVVSGLSGLRIVSFGDGLLDLDDQSVTNSDSPEGTFVASEGATLLTGVDVDSEGNLWVANYDSPIPLHKRDVNGNWSSFSFNSAAAQYPISLVVNDLDDVWMRLDPSEGGGILVFNEVENEDNVLRTNTNFGNLPSANVTDVVFDRDGQAWIGSDEGIAFIPNPIDIFEEDGFDAIQPIFENRALLDEEFITSIAVDGGNRKWIGTKNGIWLFSASGEELIANYTFENSPLPDNQIVDIEINPISGEVFIATVKGLVSMRRGSTEATAKHLNVKIFPNPIRPGYTGNVGISGLTQDAVVKITDIGGRLIKEVVAIGGTAVWDARGFGGRSAESGIYLVFSSSSDGDETFVGKIAIVR